MTQAVAREADWRGRRPLQGSHGELMRLAGGAGMVEIAATQYLTADWSLVAVCMHEAGHAAVASALGCKASIEIEHTPTGIHGWCHFDGAGRRSGARQIALAGPIADYLARYGFWSRPEDVRKAIHVYGSFISDSDRILAGDFRPEDVDATRDLVRQEWPRVYDVANRVLSQQLVRWEQ